MLSAQRVQVAAESGGPDLAAPLASISWRGVATRGVVTLCARGATLIGSALVVRSLGRGEAGSFFVLLAAMTVWSAVLSFGMPDAVSRTVGAARRRDADPQARAGFRAALTVCITGSTLVVVLAAAGVSLFGDGAGVELIAPICMGGFVAMENVAYAWLRATGRGPAAELSSAIGGVGFLVAAAAAVSIVIASADSAIGWRVAFEAAGGLVAISLVLPAVRGATSSPRKAIRPLSRLAAPMWLTGISWMALQQSDLLLLGFFKGTRTVGVYGPILKTVDLAAIPLGLLAAYTLPVAAQFRAAEHRKELGDVYASSSRIAFILSAPILALMFAMPSELVHFIFGGYLTADGEVVARVLSCAYALNALLGLNGVTLEAVGNVRTLAARSVAALVVGIVANLLLIPPLGALGAALGTLMSYVFLNCVNSGMLLARHHVVPWQPAMVAPALATVAATAAVFLTRSGAHAPPFAVPLIGAAVLAVVFATAQAADRLFVRRARRR